MHLFSTKRLLFVIVASVVCLAPANFVFAQFDFNFTINPNLLDSSDGTSDGTITAEQEADLAAALDESAAFWQQFIVGFQPGVSNNLTGIDINVGLSNFAPIDGEPNGPGGTLASAGPSGFFFNSGGFTFLTTESPFSSPSRLGGVVTIDSADFINLDSPLFADTLNHEIGHALGFGTLFEINGVLEDETGQFTGEQGRATFQQEFDPTATFIPIELDGGPGTRNGHINETIGFGPLEDLIINPNAGEPGEPDFIADPNGENDPGDLVAAPLTVLLPGDNFGRSLNDDLLTGRLNFNGDAFLSDTTVATFQDIGFQVVLPSQLSTIPEPSSLLLLGLVSLSATRRRRHGAC